MPDPGLEACRLEIAALCESALSAARSEADLGAMMAGVDALVARALQAGRPAGEPRPACGPGCASCCTLNVATLAPEGAAAADHLRRSLSEARAGVLAVRLADFQDRIRWIEDGERIAKRERCPLLDGAGACTIHPVRPLACRSVSSLDAEDCRRAMEGDEEPLVRMDLLQKALYDTAFVTVAHALEGRGLDARARDVSGMTAAFLADPGLAAAFLAGGRLRLD